MRRDEGVVAGKSADINPAYRITLVQRAKKVDVEVCYLHLFPTHFFCILAKSNQHLFFPYPLWIVPFPTELHGTAARFVYH